MKTDYNVMLCPVCEDILDDDFYCVICRETYQDSYIMARLRREVN